MAGIRTGSRERACGVACFNARGLGLRGQQPVRGGAWGEDDTHMVDMGVRVDLV